MPEQPDTATAHWERFKAATRKVLTTPKPTPTPQANSDTATPNATTGRTSRSSDLPPCKNA